MSLKSYWKVNLVGRAERARLERIIDIVKRTIRFDGGEVFFDCEVVEEGKVWWNAEKKHLIVRDWVLRAPVTQTTAMIRVRLRQLETIKLAVNFNKFMGGAPQLSVDQFVSVEPLQ